MSETASTATRGPDRRAALRVCGELRELDRLSPWITSLTRADGLPEDVAFGLDLFLQEAVGNVVEHGAPGAQTPLIEIEYRLSGDAVCLTVADTAPPFDPVAVPLGEPARTLDQATPGGHGLRLMRGFTGECRYRHEQGRNVLTLICPITG